MEDEVNYRNNPLHSIGLKVLLNELVDHYGFDILSAYLNINCFKVNPSIESSIKFLKKTDWAREKVEVFYLYEFKNLPRASDEQFLLPPRERIIPENQKPGEPAVLSIEDAERLAEKRAKKRDDKGFGARQGSKTGYAPRGKSTSSGKPYSKPREREATSSAHPASERVAKDIEKDKVDPWANARNKKRT